MPAQWWLYVLVSTPTERTYVGITTRLDHRLRAHNGEVKGGARATRPHRPWTYGAVYGPYPDRSAVSRAEWALKKTQRGAARLAWHAPEDERWQPNMAPAPSDG